MKKQDIEAKDLSVGEYVYFHCFDDYNTWEPGSIINIDEQYVTIKNFINETIKRKIEDVGTFVVKRPS